MADINDTTPASNSNFFTKQAFALYEARAELEGAIALFKKDPSWEGNDDRVCISFILDEVSRKLEAVAGNIEDSDRDYTINQQ